jgi:AraC-like DNA-binding protein
MGTSLHAYRNQLRLRRAIGLIEEGARDLAGLAMQLGYSSHSHFSLAFREAFGCTPAQLRREVRRPSTAGTGRTRRFEAEPR